MKAYFGNIDFVKIAKEIVSVPEIIDPIIEAKLAKQIAADKRAVTLAQKKMTKTDVDKYKPAKSRNVKEKTCFICEGDSAVSSAIQVRNIQTQGFFPLRGNVLNTYGKKESDIISNKELKSIMTILNLKFPEYYKIELDDGTEIIASNNDEVHINGRWVPVESIIKDLQDDESE